MAPSPIFRICWVLGLGVGLLTFGGCSRSETDRGPQRPRYVTTIPPFEMILRPMVEGRGTVERLLAPGASPHSYDPTPSDLRLTTQGTALIYGAESLDGWAADLPAPRRLELANLVPPTARLGFEEEEGGKSGTMDPHFWTDPLAVRQLLPALADTLCALDARGCSIYQANADSFSTALLALDSRLQSLVEPVRESPVLLAQPFFRYFLHRYGPRLVGVIEPHPGAEPTPGQLSRFIERARASEARAILTQRSHSDRAARAVAEASPLVLVRLDPLGGTEGRRTYADLLLQNARMLRDSLTASFQEKSGSAPTPSR